MKHEKIQNFSNINAQLEEFQWNLGSRKTSCKPTVLCSVIINSKRSENLPLVIVELKSFLLSWKYFEFWLKGQALLFCSDYDNNLPEIYPSVHPLCLWTLCELCSLWWSSATHFCVCEKDILLARWGVRGLSFCYSMHNSSRRVLCKPLGIHILKRHALFVHRHSSWRMLLAKSISDDQQGQWGPKGSSNCFFRTIYTCCCL